MPVDAIINTLYYYDNFLMSETQQLIILVRDSCIIFILFLCCIQQYWQFTFFLLVCTHSEREFFYAPRPLIDRAPRNDATSLTTYTTHTRA